MTPSQGGDPVPDSVLEAIFHTARARGLCTDDPSDMAPPMRKFGSGLFPEGGPTPPCAASRVPDGFSAEPRAIGELFWKAKSGDVRAQRMDGRYYTPTPVIDRILDLVWGDLFPHDEPGDAIICDPSVGCGFFLLRLVERVRERYSPGAPTLRSWAERTLYGVDSDPGAAFVARACLWLALSEPGRDFSAKNIGCGDSLLGPGFSPRRSLFQPAARPGSVDWGKTFPDAAARGGFDAVIGNPPYEVLTDFGRHPERRELANALRDTGMYPDSLGGQLNLYRLFVERSLALLRPGGIVSMIVPISLARDASAKKLRRRLLLGENADVWLLHREEDGVFPGIAQATCIFRARKDGGTVGELHVETGNARKSSPLAEIRGGDMAIPFPDDDAAELAAWLAERFPGTLADYADIRVGEVDQAVFRDCMKDEPTGCVLARGTHLTPFRLDAEPRPSPARFLDLDRFLAKKKKQAEACAARAASVRIAQLGIRNMRAVPRLAAALVPPGVYLGNSLNAYSPKPGVGAVFLAALLNSRLLDRLFRRISGNNNINLHEMRGMPIPGAVPDGLVRRVEAAYRACEAAAAAGEDPLPHRGALDEAICDCYGLPREWRDFLGE